MTDGMGMDLSQLNTLAADMGTVADNAGPLINSAVQVTSRKIKTGAAKSVRGRKHFKQAAAAIDYEVKTLQAFGVSLIQSEIGYDKERPAGELGNLIEFGAPNSPGGPLAPTSDLVIELWRNTDDFEKGLTQATIDAERKAGL